MSLAGVHVYTGRTAGACEWCGRLGAGCGSLRCAPEEPLIYRTAVRRRWPVRFFEAPA